jgi:hypothetical protein
MRIGYPPEMTSTKPASDYRVKDPVFNGMSLARCAGANYGMWFVRCECWRFKPLVSGHGNSRKRAKCQGSYVDSLIAARDWALTHLLSPDHCIPPETQISQTPGWDSSSQRSKTHTANSEDVNGD